MPAFMLQTRPTSPAPSVLNVSGEMQRYGDADRDGKSPAALARCAPPTLFVILILILVLSDLRTRRRRLAPSGVQFTFFKLRMDGRL